MSDFPSSSVREAVEKRNYTALASQPSAWCLQAHSLRHAANVLLRVQKSAFEKQAQEVLERFREEFPEPRKETLSEEEAETFLDSQMSPVYYLLIGLSLENLLKGIAIGKNPHFVKGGIELTGIAMDHNLVKLAGKGQADIGPQQDEKEILKCLSFFVRCRGRYLISKKFEFAGSQGSLSPSPQQIEDLWQKIRKLVPQDPPRVE